MRKKLTCLLIIVLFYLVKGSIASAELVDYYDISPELSQMQNILSNNESAYNKVLDITPKTLIKDLLKGDFKFSMKNFSRKVITILLEEILNNANLLVNLTVLAMLCAILKNIQSSFCSDNVSNIAFYICNIVIISILLKCFNNCINITKSVINDMSIFSYSVIPISTSLMLTSGQVIKSSSLKPFILCGISIIVSIIKRFSLPLIYASTILEFLNNITDRVQISRLGKLLKNVSSIVNGFVLTVFIGVITIKGTMASSVDTLTSKTAKYMFGTFIPVVGKYLADVADNVIGSLMLIKNVTGIVSVIGILVICITPIIKLFSVVSILKIIEAVLEPVTDKRVINLVGEISKSVSSIIGIIFLLAVILILSFTVLIKV